jgi:hypothetical protein
MVTRIKRKHPLAGTAFDKLQVVFSLHRSAQRLMRWLRRSEEIFVKYDTDKDKTWTLNEAAHAFHELSTKITTLPAVGPFLLFHSSSARLTASKRHDPTDRSSGIAARRIPWRQIGIPCQACESIAGQRSAQSQ